jgi:hypothetical protein
VFADLDVQPGEFVAQHSVEGVDGELGSVVKLQGDDRVGAKVVAVVGCDFGDGAVDDGPDARPPRGCVVEALRVSPSGGFGPSSLSRGPVKPIVRSWKPPEARLPTRP